MYIIPVAWLYVALMMSVAEANNTQGTLLGACITFLLYGLLPVGIVLYVMGSPARRRAIRAREAHSQDQAQALTENLAIYPEKAHSSNDPDAGSHATGATSDRSSAAVAPMGKEP